MNFNININSFIQSDIVKINHSLLPETFRGDMRKSRCCYDAISIILDEIGYASAKAQGLMKPITTAERLRNSDHTVYLLIERDGNEGKGTVVGMLKMGRKSLYIFDEIGDIYNEMSLCVLDFYVHESRQRKGCGKMLFDYMLKEERVTPDKLAIDRPSDKFLSFLRKHYGLDKMIRQTNNFVVFKGFFDKRNMTSLSGGGADSKEIACLLTMHKIAGSRACRPLDGTLSDDSEPVRCQIKLQEVLEALKDNSFLSSDLEGFVF